MIWGCSGIPATDLAAGMVTAGGSDSDDDAEYFDAADLVIDLQLADAAGLAEEEEEEAWSHEEWADCAADDSPCAEDLLRGAATACPSRSPFDLAPLIGSTTAAPSTPQVAEAEVSRRTGGAAAGAPAACAGFVRKRLCSSKARPLAEAGIVIFGV